MGKFYSLKNIPAENEVCTITIGGRVNRKNLVLEYGIKNYIKKGEQMAIVRHWSDNFTVKRGQKMFDGIANTDKIAKMTEGKWTGIYYYASRWYLCRWEENKRIVDETPFCYTVFIWKNRIIPYYSCWSILKIFSVVRRNNG